MGIIMFPFLLGSIIIAIIAFIKLVKLAEAKAIKIKEISFGLFTSIALFGLICLVYILEGSAWGLSPYFRIPIFLVFIPFIIHLITKKNKKKTIESLSKILLISIVFSTILGIIFNDIFSNLVDYLDIKKYY